MQKLQNQPVKPEPVTKEEQEELVKLFQLSKFSNGDNPEQAESNQSFNLDFLELEKVLQKEGGIEATRLKNIDTEACEKIKKELNEKDDEVSYNQNYIANERVRR